MAGRHLTPVLVQVAVAVVGHVVFDVPFASLSEFQLRGVGIGRTEIFDAH